MRTEQEYRTSEYHPATGWLRRAAPRPPQPLPVQPWARAYALIRAPRQRSARGLPDRPGLDSGYAMTTNLDDPVIIATLSATGARQLDRC